jgi:predicted transcriptional regulator
VSADEAGAGYADVDALFGAAPTDEADVELPSGARVRVKGLTRAQFLIASRAVADGGPIELERQNIAAAMVRPRMTADQVAEWQRRASAGELIPLVDRIRELSGMAAGAAKSRLPADGDQ